MDVLAQCTGSWRGCPGFLGIDDFGVNETAKAIIRIDNLVFLLVTLLLFGYQTWRMWGELGKRRQFLCLALGMFMFSGIEGTVEQLLGWTFGPRVLFLWLSCIFVLYAVVLRRVDPIGFGSPRQYDALSAAERAELEELRTYRRIREGHDV